MSRHFSDQRDDQRGDQRSDRRSSIPHKRSADDSRSLDSESKRSKGYTRDYMDIDYQTDKPDSLPRHLKYWLESNQERNFTSKSYELELGLGAQIRKLEFELFLRDLEIEKWESQIAGMDENLKEIDDI